MLADVAHFRAKDLGQEPEPEGQGCGEDTPTPFPIFFNDERAPWKEERLGERRRVFNALVRQVLGDSEGVRRLPPPQDLLGVKD